MEDGRPSMASCVVCGGSEISPLFRSVDFQYKVSGTFTVTRCRTCGLDAIDPIPDAQSFYFDQDLYPYALASLSWRTRLKTRVKSALLTCRRYANLPGFYGRMFQCLVWPFRARLLPVDPHGKTVFEVGAGNGRHLLELRALGWKVAGCELSESGVSAARAMGLAVDRGSLETGGYPSASFDVLYLDQVFEHVSDPRGFLKEAGRVLKPDGLLVIGVPNAEALSYHLFGKWWGLLALPFHLFQYSRHTLRLLLETSGFDVVRFRYVPLSMCWVWSVNNWVNAAFGHSSDRGFVNNRFGRLIGYCVIVPLLMVMRVVSPARLEMVMVYATPKTCKQEGLK